MLVVSQTSFFFSSNKVAPGGGLLYGTEFTPLSETTSIPVCFIYESPPPRESSTSVDDVWKKITDWLQSLEKEKSLWWLDSLSNFFVKILRWEKQPYYTWLLSCGTPRPIKFIIPAVYCDLECLRQLATLKMPKASGASSFLFALKTSLKKTLVRLHLAFGPFLFEKKKKQEEEQKL